MINDDKWGKKAVSESPFIHYCPLSSVRVFIANTSGFWCLRSDTQMDIKLFTEFQKTKKK